jgi:2-phosphosulfolactate phosphatase
VTAPNVIRRSLLAGTHGITGPTVVIDTFRAFTTAAFLLDRGVDRIVLTESLDEARERSRSLTDSLLCGEEGGHRPDGFDLGNSPTQVEKFLDPGGRAVVMRTSSGTRSVVSAMRSGGNPVFAASLVVAGATVTAVSPESRVTIIASGLSGVTVADEDEETADLIASRLLGRPDDPERLSRIRVGSGAQRLRTTPWIDPEDLERCLAVDRFDFAMQARFEDEVAVLRRRDR